LLGSRCSQAAVETDAPDSPGLRTGDTTGQRAGAAPTRRALRPNAAAGKPAGSTPDGSSQLTSGKQKMDEYELFLGQKFDNPSMQGMLCCAAGMGGQASAGDCRLQGKHENEKARKIEITKFLSI
jgi:hypothetical protein